MGLLQALFSGRGFAFNRMAKTFKEVYDNIKRYQLYKNVDYLYKAAWLLKYGVLNSIEKWNWSLAAKIMIPDYQSLGRITLHQAMIIAMSSIMDAGEGLSAEQKTCVEKIIEGEKAYDDAEYMISSSLKEKLMP